jgi:hypothetical protein
MITKEQLAEAMGRECDIAIHLFSKFTPQGYDYRPSEGQRTTTELLRYLAICGIAGLTCMRENNWKLFSEIFGARVKEMPPEGFPAAMEQQKSEINAFFAGLTEEALATQDSALPGGTPMPLGAAILNGPAKWLPAYKMQLFLYAKAAGAEGLKTSNVWRGTDPAPAA